MKIFQKPLLLGIRINRIMKKRIYGMISNSNLIGFKKRIKVWREGERKLIIKFCRMHCLRKT